MSFSETARRTDVTSDFRLSSAQREYLRAFDLHLRARNDGPALEEANRRTNATLMALGQAPRSTASRSWIDSLLSDLAVLGGGERQFDEGGANETHP